MKKTKLIIAIDPDVEASGVAVLDVEKKSLTVATEPFPVLINGLQSFKGIVDGFCIYVEASWLTTHNHHVRKGQSVASIAATSMSIGRNHEVGRKIVEMCKHYGLNVVEQPPLAKCWKGRDRKITHEEIASFIPDFPKRSNQEERDAALMAWVCAGLSIKINPMKK